MNEEIRKAGDYTITNSIHIGDKEFVMGENLKADDGNFYLVGECNRTDLFEAYENCLVGGDYIEIAEIFSQKITQQVNQMKEYYKSIPEDKTAIQLDACIPLHECRDITNQIVVVRPSVLRAEYRIAQSQIYLAKSGNGTRYNSLGTAVYCDNLYTGKHTRYERYDFMGILKPEHYPEWLKDKLAIQNNPLTFEYGGYHFLPVGVINKTKTLEELSKKTASDRTMGIWSTSYNKMYGKGKVEYTHKGFYSACGNIFCDVFKCLENGKYYMPGANELFLYDGKFKAYEEKPHKTKGNKEVER